MREQAISPKPTIGIIINMINKINKKVLLIVGSKYLK